MRVAELGSEAALTPSWRRGCRFRPRPSLAFRMTAGKRRPPGLPTRPATTERSTDVGLSDPPRDCSDPGRSDDLPHRKAVDERVRALPPDADARGRECRYRRPRRPMARGARPDRAAPAD